MRILQRRRRVQSAQTPAHRHKPTPPPHITRASDPTRPSGVNWQLASHLHLMPPQHEVDRRWAAQAMIMGARGTCNVRGGGGRRTRRPQCALKTQSSSGVWQGQTRLVDGVVLRMGFWVDVVDVCGGFNEGWSWWLDGCGMGVRDGWL